MLLGSIVGKLNGIQEGSTEDVPVEVGSRKLAAHDGKMVVNNGYNERDVGSSVATMVGASIGEPDCRAGMIVGTTTRALLGVPDGRLVDGAALGELVGAAVGEQEGGRAVGPLDGTL
jgi:hypothetical protein